jgi:kynurenine 3-monooxygenase
VSHPVTVLGAGCTGPLLGIMLARRGMTVRIYERRADPRVSPPTAGRSINLALAARGIAGLERAAVAGRVRELLVPMRGRMIHELDGSTRFLPYGQRPHELLYSVSRAALNHVLLESAEAAGVKIEFGTTCLDADFAAGVLTLEDGYGRRSRRLISSSEPVIGADGAGSILRERMVRAGLAGAREEFLAHDYKELTIAPGADGGLRLPGEALHIWPRGGYMLIALPNIDGSLTATLFLARSGEPVSFANLSSPAAVEALFCEQFADARALLPDLTEQFFANPTGVMGTVYAAPWHVDGRALLIGDAAHAIVPFHGQGMNCAFEDCVLLDDLVGSAPDWQSRFAGFDRERREDTAAIAQMAIENYTEMRATVREPRFQLQKELSLELERRYPERFIPRYSMVMFHAEIPYTEALRRGTVQGEILERATARVARLADIDWRALGDEIESRLSPLIPARAGAA